MVWQKIFGSFRQLSKKSARQHRQRRLRLERMERRELLASDLGAITGVAFVDQDNDGIQSIGEPQVLVDVNGDLVPPGTPGALGVQVQLFRDSNMDGSFDGLDTLVGTATTDGLGNYRFDGLTEDKYFLQQQTVPQLNTPASITIDITSDDADGTRAALIDDYSLTSQTVNATSNSTNNAFASANEVIGGERHIEVINTSATGQISVTVDAGVNDSLSIGSLNATGSALLQYDGADNNIALDATGLSGVSLTGDPTGTTADPAAGLLVRTRSDAPGETLTITVYTDAGNSSSTNISVPENTSNTVETFVPFSTFNVVLGAGADFTNVGAIEASVTLAANSDVIASIVESRRPGIAAVSIPSTMPVSLSGTLFEDNSVGGQNNGIREVIEPGIAGVTVDLYQLSNANDTLDPASATPLTSTITDASGEYNFPALEPGHYATAISASQFQSGGILFGFANSTGNDPPTDPDDNVDNDDNGITLPSGDVISETISLASNSEPIDDGDTDPSTNTTVDFGFFPQMDLSITKTQITADSNISADGNVVFEIVVSNLGPLEATNVQVQDIFPAGLTYTGNDSQSGSFTVSVNGSTVTVDMGTIAANSSESIRLLADIDANQTDDITNTASVTGFEEETDLTNNSEDETLELLSSDLRIEKTDLTDPVLAGEQLTYEITVTNDGPDPAAGVVVEDTLPAGVNFFTGDVGGDSNLVSFDGATGIVTATIGPLANQEARVITITVDVAADASSLVSNTATVTATPNSDPDASNNTTSEDTVVTRVVDLDIDKQVSGDPIAGQDITYTITVSNIGATEAAAVTVTDTLDPDLQFVSFDAQSSGATITQNGQDLTFDIGLLAPSATATFSFIATIDSSAIGNIANSATVTTSDSDSDSSNNTSVVNITAESHVDLVLDKQVDLATAIPGSNQLIYTFTIDHDTDTISDASNVVVTDTLPTGLTGVLISAPTADATNFDPATGEVTVTYNTLLIGETRMFTVTADVQEDATGDVVNSGNVTSAGTEIDPTNNNDTATTTLTPDFDVVVAKVVDNNSPNPNDTVTYTVTVTNEGPSTAPGVVLSDVIPTSMTLVSATMESQNGTLDGGTVTFPSVDLASAQTATATLIFTVDSDADGVLTNNASVPDMTASGENDTTNNASSADVTVVAIADLAIEKTASSDLSQAGSALTYTITVTNNGPSSASDVVVEDTLPTGVTFVSGTGPTGQALTENNGVVTADGGTLTNGGSFMMTINVTIDGDATGDLVNSATVSATTLDNTPNNDAATATTAVDPLSSSISGAVYADRNNNGIRDDGELGIAGVTITLGGTDSLGTPVSQTVVTDANGLYVFSDLAQGVYSITETQPAHYLEGMLTLGTGASAVIGDNVFTELGLAADTSAIDFNFGELYRPLSLRSFLASS